MPQAPLCASGPSLKPGSRHSLLHLRSFVTYSQNDWDSLLPMAQIALDNKPATTTGVSPFFLSHGYDAENIVLADVIGYALKSMRRCLRQPFVLAFGEI